MRLNPDCVRDILTVVEDTATFNLAPSQKEFSKAGLFQKYGQETLLYHIRLCFEANLISNVKFYFSGFMIQDLTPSGHEFMNNIRNENNWGKTKETAKKVGSTSLSALQKISENVIAQVISNYLK